jgi:hypothetical protein
MEEKIFLSELTENSVNVVKKTAVTVDNKEYFIGLPHRRAYENSTVGREAIAQDLSGTYLSAVMTVWGEQPTVIYPTEDSMFS